MAHSLAAFSTLWPLPKEVKGLGVTEAPCGALAIGSGSRTPKSRIISASCRRPGTARPRDRAGNIGAFEASLMNTKMERPEEPVEILRTLHSSTLASPAQPM
jgi:hydrogenase large subunit